MIHRTFPNPSRPTHLIGNPVTGAAVLIDPGADIQCYVEEAERLKLEIAHVFTSTFDADVLRSLLILRRLCGSCLHVTPEAPPHLHLNPFLPGCSLTIGSLRIRMARNENERNRLTVTHIGEAGDETLVGGADPDSPLRRTG